MGTVRVTKHAPASDVQALNRWYSDKLEEMALEDGSGSYCGNWNACGGLTVVQRSFATVDEAECYADKVLDKGDVLAMRVGDFKKRWPETKTQVALNEKLTSLTTESTEFEYRVLERVRKQKSGTKKCSHCQSSISVKALHLPALSELQIRDRSSPDVYSMYRMGRHLFANYLGLTDCPVCHKNLLMTETDHKNQASLKKRLAETSVKALESKTEYAKQNTGKPQPFWYVAGDCPE